MKVSYTTIVIWALLLTAPLWMPWVGGYTALGSRVLVMGLAAMALNLLLGHTGGLSFGHAAYFGLGTYGTGLLLRYMTHSTLLALLGGVVLAGLVATLVGPVLVRRRGIYFSMITIAIGQMFYFVAVRWNSLTGGEDGLAGFSRQPLDFGGHILVLQGVSFYYFTLLWFAVGIGVLAVVLRSPLGHTFVAVRDNERRLRFLGVSIEKYIWISFSISGFVAGLAGGLNALLNNFAAPSDLYWTMSGDLVIMCVLGGMRSFWGPLIGATIFVVVQDYLSSITQNWMTFIGLLFIAVVLLFPQGLLGFLKRRVNA